MFLRKFSAVFSKKNSWVLQKLFFYKKVKQTPILNKVEKLTKNKYGIAKFLHKFFIEIFPYLTTKVDKRYLGIE